RRGARHQTGHRLVGQDRIGSPDRSFAVAERVPGKTDTRLKVLIVLVINIVVVCTGPNERSAPRIEYDKTVVAFGRSHIPVVPKSKLERQVRPQPVVVLHKEPDRALSDAA